MAICGSIWPSMITSTPTPRCTLSVLMRRVERRRSESAYANETTRKPRVRWSSVRPSHPEPSPPSQSWPRPPLKSIITPHPQSKTRPASVGFERAVPLAVCRGKASVTQGVGGAGWTPVYAPVRTMAAQMMVM